VKDRVVSTENAASRKRLRRCSSTKNAAAIIVGLPKHAIISLASFTAVCVRHRH